MKHFSLSLPLDLSSFLPRLPPFQDPVKNFASVLRRTCIWPRNHLPLQMPIEFGSSRLAVTHEYS